MTTRLTSLTQPTAILALSLLSASAHANTSLWDLSIAPLQQDWTNTALITDPDSWSGVPSFMGYRGDDGTPGTGTDPQTILADLSTVIDVNVGQMPTFGTGGVAEFELADPVVAFQGSGTADAPNLVAYLNATGLFDISVSYLLRDVDGTVDNAVQAVALQYRLNGTGSYINVPGAFVSDATTGPSLATLTSTVSVTLPPEANGASMLEVRWITSNAAGNDEWVGVDNIVINGMSGPTLSLYWDPNGAAAGIGGSGTWTTTSLTWNDTDQGTSPPLAFDPEFKAVFGGVGGTVTIAGNVTLNKGVEVNVDGYHFTGGSLVLSAPSFRVTNATDTALVSATLSGTAGLRKLGAGRLVLAGTNDYSGTTTVQEGTLQISADAQLGVLSNPVVLAGGTLRTTASLILDAARALSGSGGLDIAPGSTLLVQGNAALGAVALKNTGQLNLSGANPSVGDVLFEAAGNIVAPNGPVTLNGNVTTTHATGTAAISAPLALGNSNRRFVVGNGSEAVDLLVSAALTASGPFGRVVKEGEGTLDLAGDNSGLLGGVRLGLAGTAAAPGGTLIVHDGNALGTGVFQFNAGTLQVASPNPVVFVNEISIGAGETGNGAVFSGAPMEFAGAASLFLPQAVPGFQHRIVANTQLTFLGGLNASSGVGGNPSLGLTIAGTGKVLVTNTANTIAENITVDGPELSVSGGFSALPTITVQNGGRLSGATNTGVEVGEQLGAVTIGAGSRISPGEASDATGTLHVGNLTLAGLFEVDLQGLGPGDHDQVSVTGSVDLSGSDLSLTLGGGYLPFPDDAFTIILNDGADPVIGVFAGKGDGIVFAAAGSFFAIDYQGGDGNDVVLTVIPEPATGLLLLGGVALCVRRRRKA